MAAASLVALALPRGYRSGCLILVNPPRTAASLKVAPEPLHMTTVHALANSDFVLDRTLDLLERRRAAVGRVLESLQSNPVRGEGDRWRTLEGLSPVQAGALAGGEDPEGFAEVWEDLPPASLLPSLMDIDLEYIRKLDPILFRKHLSSRIRTSLENMHQVEYQPVLELEVDWASPGGAALTAHTWAGALIRTLREQHLEPTLELQAMFRDRLMQVDQSIDRLDERIEQIRDESGLRRSEGAKQAALEALYGETVRIADPLVRTASLELARVEPNYQLNEGLSEVVARIRSGLARSESLIAARNDLLLQTQNPQTDEPSRLQALSELEVLGRRIEEETANLEALSRDSSAARAALAKAEAERVVEERKREHLVQQGALEAMSVNYEEMWGVRLMTPPTPPRTHSSPVVWKFAALGALAGFTFNSLLVFMNLSLLRIPPERWDEK